MHTNILAIFPFDSANSANMKIYSCLCNGEYIHLEMYGNIIIFGDLVSSKGGKKSFYKKPKSDTDLLKTFPRLRNSKG